MVMDAVDYHAGQFSVGIGFIFTSGGYADPKASMSGNADRHSLLNIVLSDLLDALCLDSSTLLV